MLTVGELVTILQSINPKLLVLGSLGCDTYLGLATKDDIRGCCPAELSLSDSTDDSYLMLNFKHLIKKE